MKTEKFDGEIAEFQGSKKNEFGAKNEDGKPIMFPIAYSGTVEQYENVAEAKAGEDWLNDNDILRVVNAKKLAAAKSAEYQKATKSLKEAYDKSPAKARKDFIDSALKSPQVSGDIAKAEAMADQFGF